MGPCRMVDQVSGLGLEHGWMEWVDTVRKDWWPMGWDEMGWDGVGTGQETGGGVESGGVENTQWPLPPFQVLLG